MGRKGQEKVTNKEYPKKKKKKGFEGKSLEDVFVSLGISEKTTNLGLLQRAQPNNPHLLV